MTNVPDFLVQWPLYVNDNGKVTCNHEECGDDEDIVVPYRRVTVEEYLQGLRDHIRRHHSL